MLFEAKSKWCADFFRTVREVHWDMSRTDWFRWKVAQVAICTPIIRQVPEAQVALFAKEEKMALLNFQLMFRHLRFPAGAQLAIIGKSSSTIGSAWLALRMPDGSTSKVEDITVSPWSVEEAWEKAVLSLISCQFYLWHHSLYRQETILLGNALKFEAEMHRWTVEGVSIDKFKSRLSPKHLARFEKGGFAPKVRWFGLFPRIVYHVFSPFGGIYRRVAGWPRWLCSIGRNTPIVAYRSEIIY